MCLTFKHLFKHLVNKGHSIPVLVYLQDFYNNTRYCYELKCGPGQRGLSGHSQRFPSLECEAYPRDLLVDCVWFKRAFTLVSEKRWHHNCHRLWWHCGCRFPFSRTLFPSSCDVFSWLLSSFVTSLVCAFFLSRFVHNIMTLYGITHHCLVVVWVVCGITFLLITRYTRATCSHSCSCATLPTHALVWIELVFRFWCLFF